MGTIHGNAQVHPKGPIGHNNYNNRKQCQGFRLSYVKILWNISIDLLPGAHQLNSTSRALR